MNPFRKTLVNHFGNQQTTDDLQGMTVLLLNSCADLFDEAESESVYAIAEAEVLRRLRPYRKLAAYRYLREKLSAQASKQPEFLSLERADRPYAVGQRKYFGA